MADLLWYQYVLIGLIFAWSGFVRTSLGFGGAVLALPFLLLVVNEQQRPRRKPHCVDCLLEYPSVRLEGAYAGGDHNRVEVLKQPE